MLSLDLGAKVYVVTGANGGLGRAISEYLAGRGATLYMVCRNKERGDKARDEIVQQTGNQKVHTLIADVALAAEVRSAMAELASREKRVDGIVCNAGAMTPEKTITPEGFETTLAAGLLHGAYLLSSLALPLLRKSADPRVTFLSSGGMYNGKFPGFAVANCESAKYNQEYAYVYVKRAQVILAEELTKLAPDVKWLSVHPGWTETPGVTGWLGSGQKYLQPMRNLWQGVEGISWMTVCPGDELKSGEFYLDRRPQVKHIAGAFFSEGTYTKNTKAEVEQLMSVLHEKVGKFDPSGPVVPHKEGDEAKPEAV
uniref:Uncharacterized protein n=1 Tax=Coccolithus braarudii TaxID=221442 RepID=A0A7S0LBH1_9EUKA